MKWDKFKFVLDVFFRFRKWLENQNFVNFGWWLGNCSQKNQPTEPLKFLGGSWLSQLWEKIPQKGNENNNPSGYGHLEGGALLPGVWWCIVRPRRKVSNPFRCNLEGVLLVAQLMVNWWFEILGFLWESQSPFIFRGSKSESKAKKNTPNHQAIISFWCPCKIGLSTWSNDKWAGLGLVMSFKGRNKVRVVSSTN